MKRTLADDFADLRVGAVRQGVHLSRLELTEPGDVFYVLGTPETVWMRSPREPRWADDHLFIEMGGDAWRKMEVVGGPRARVMVIHNTREPLAQGSGDG